MPIRILPTIARRRKKSTPFASLEQGGNKIIQMPNLVVILFESTFAADMPHPTAGLTTFVPEEHVIHYDNNGVHSDGRTVKMNAVTKMDGRWSPVRGNLVADDL